MNAISGCQNKRGAELAQSAVAGARLRSSAAVDPLYTARRIYLTEVYRWAEHDRPSPDLVQAELDALASGARQIAALLQERFSSQAVLP